MDRSFRLSAGRWRRAASWVPLGTVGLVAVLIGEAYARLGAWPQPMRWVPDTPFPLPANTDPATWSGVYVAVLVGLMTSTGIALGALLRWSVRHPIERASVVRLTLGCALLLGWVLVDPGGTWDWFRD